MPRQTDCGQVVILVVDGEVVSRNLTANTLQRAGYAVLAAAHGREALELVQTYDGRIDLLITELDIPKLGGLELCEAATQARPAMKFCAMSANASDSERARARNVPFVLKPLDPELLRREFEDLLILPACSDRRPPQPL